MKECNVESNIKRCNCSYQFCEKKGVCCQCLHYHLSRGEVPACFFPDDVERTYDRSLDNFIKVYQKRGKWW